MVSLCNGENNPGDVITVILCCVWDFNVLLICCIPCLLASQVTRTLIWSSITKDVSVRLLRFRGDGRLERGQRSSHFEVFLSVWHFFLVTVCYRSALTIQFPTNIDTIQVLYYSKSLCLIYIWLTVYGGFEAWLTPRTKIQHISASAAFI